MNLVRRTGRKLFRIRGGVQVNHRKGWTSELAAETMPVPARLVLPLQQHIGAPAVPVVRKGEQVLKGQLIARAQGAISAPVHAPTSGKVVKITTFQAPHPSGLAQPAIVLAPDGADRWADLEPPFPDPFAAPPKAIADHVAESGIVGLGGAGFPTAVKLDLGTRNQLDTLVINGAECEPYLTSDDRLMREEASAIVDGARIMAYALGVSRILIAIETNKPAALAAMTRAVETATDDADNRRAGSTLGVAPIPARYPMGSERHLVHTLTGRETPARKLTADIGVVVHNVATARAIHHAVRFGRPLVSRLVTVSGRAIARAANVEVLLGTMVSDLLAHCGGTCVEPAKLIAGGPMMGTPLPGTEVPVVKGTGGILALSRDELQDGPVQPCLRCGTCVGACPCGLMPLEMAALVRQERLEDAAAIGLLDCLNCGCCAYACPSKLPLVQTFTYAKGRLAAQDRDKQKQDRVRRMTLARTARLDRIAKAKSAAAAAKKKAKAKAKEAPAAG